MPKMEQARTDHSCGGGWHAALDGGGGGGGGREIGFELIGVPFREARRRARSTLRLRPACRGGFSLGKLLAKKKKRLPYFRLFFCYVDMDMCMQARWDDAKNNTTNIQNIFLFAMCLPLRRAGSSRLVCVHTAQSAEFERSPQTLKTGRLARLE